MQIKIDLSLSIRNLRIEGEAARMIMCEATLAPFKIALTSASAFLRALVTSLVVSMHMSDKVLALTDYFVTSRASLALRSVN
jgi:hypothetical protein